MTARCANCDDCCFLAEAPDVEEICSQFIDASENPEDER